MDRVNLPWIAGTASLREAVEVMTKHRTSGVVAETSAGPQVIDLDSVLFNLRTGGAVSVGALTPRFRTIAVAHAASSAPANPRIEDEMDRAGAAFAVILGERFVLSRHESYGTVFGYMPPLYRCDDNQAHVWCAEQLSQPGNRCPHDGHGTSLI